MTNYSINLKKAIKYKEWSLKAFNVNDPMASAQFNRLSMNAVDLLNTEEVDIYRKWLSEWLYDFMF